MPDIPSMASLFVDATTLTATAFGEAVYLPDATTPASFEVINGWIDEDNADNAKNFEINDRMVQRGALSRVGQVGSTMALDYFADLFNDRVFSQTGYSTVDDLPSFIAVPGATATFYVKDTPELVLVSWNVYWESDLDTSGRSCPFRFAVNGRPKTGGNTQRRCTPQAVHALKRYSRFANQWTGHAILTSADFNSDEWNSIGLQIAVSKGATQVRVRNRAIRWLQLR